MYTILTATTLEANMSHNELKFDAHGECCSGSDGWGMMEVILLEFVAYPQLLHALHINDLCAPPLRPRGLDMPCRMG